MPESFAFRISGVEPRDAEWRKAGPELRREFWRAVVAIGLVVKDEELARGLDRHGVPMVPIAPYTRMHRKSAMGYADPNAPPLTPAYGPSRTRSLLAGRAGKNYAEFYWRFDAVMGKHWGRVLGYHRAGAGRLPKRDVIGLSPASLTTVRHKAQVWWDYRKRGIVLEQAVRDFKLPATTPTMPAKIPIVGRTDFENFTFGIGGDLSLAERATAAGTFTGFRQFHPPADGAAVAKGKPKAPAAAAAKAHRAHSFPPRPHKFKPGKPAPVLATKGDPKTPTPKPKPPAVKPPVPLPPLSPKVPAFTPKPLGPIPAFPSSLDSLQHVKELGGSTGAKLVKDPATGKQFVQKKGGNAGHLREEAAADAAYQALGIAVAKSQVYDAAGKPVKLAEYLEGRTLGELRASDPAAFVKAVAELRKGFVADALLGNWDVVGLNYDNVLVTKDGRVVRIDNGGSLRYRAQGAKKAASQWSGDLAELDSMRDPSVNPSAAMVFVGMKDEEIRKQAGGILAKRDALLAAVPADLHATLEARLEALAKIVTGQPAIAPKPNPPVAALSPAPEPKLAPRTESWAPRPSKDFRAIATSREMEEWGAKHYGEWAESLTPTEQRVLKLYATEIYKEMNGILRGTLKDSDLKFGLSRESVEKMAGDAATALSKARTPEDLVGFRGVKDFGAMGFASIDDFAPGTMLGEKGFSSVSLNQEKAKQFAYSLGDSPARAVLFRINIPKGSTGGYLNAGELAKYDDERELLFPPAAEYKVVGHGKPVNQAGEMIPVVILERVK